MTTRKSNRALVKRIGVRLDRGERQVRWFERSKEPSKRRIGRALRQLQRIMRKIHRDLRDQL